ncbi:MAG: hypothetical protein ABIO05_05250 [Ferruginibacter sp.]
MTTIKTFDEVCIVLDGTVHIMVKDEVIEVKKGGWHLRPRSKVQTFWNLGKKKARVFGHETYMQDLAKLFKNNARPNPGDLQHLATSMSLFFGLAN